MRALVLALAAPAARAHELQAERDGEELVLRYGHGGEALPLDAGKVKVIRRRRTGAAADVRAGARAGLRVPARCDAASVALDSGFWSLTPDGEKNLPRNQVPDSVRSWRSLQLARWVDARSLGAGAALGDELGIVPAGDVSRAKQGERAALRVLWQGKPVPGAVLEIDDEPLGETDPAGQCRVKPRAADVESVSVTLERPLGTPEVDVLVAEASLTFEVAR